jgi:nitrate reductase NapD
LAGAACAGEQNVNLSGILVIAAPGRFDEVVASLPGLPGVEVHHVDAAASRAVVVQEAAGIDQEVDGLRRIQLLPGVASAEMVYHYFGDDPSLDRAPTPA